MYYPKEDKNYKKVGLASWYGDAFHGRLTANGEIYDMTHLTAAHPTMPLPSYARVTNIENGSSVIVRVNDRGPYSHDRLIDLSKRAAEMLDYTRMRHRQGEGRICRPRAARRPRRPVSDGVLPPRQPRARSVRRSGDRRDDRHERADAERPMSGRRGFPGALLDRPIRRRRRRAAFALPAFGPIAPERPAFDVPAAFGPGRHGLAVLCRARSTAQCRAFAAFDGRACRRRHRRAPGSG